MERDILHKLICMEHILNINLLQQDLLIISVNQSLQIIGKKIVLNKKLNRYYMNVLRYNIIVFIKVLFCRDCRAHDVI